jgi:hypothetical protein
MEEALVGKGLALIPNPAPNLVVEARELMQQREVFLLVQSEKAQVVKRSQVASWAVLRVDLWEGQWEAIQWVGQQDAQQVVQQVVPLVVRKVGLWGALRWAHLLVVQQPGPWRLREVRKVCLWKIELESWLPCWELQLVVGQVERDLLMGQVVVLLVVQWMNQLLAQPVA